MPQLTEERMRALGFEREDRTPRTAQITFYGSGSKAPGDHYGVEVGDPVEVLVEGSGGKGEWREGLVCLSPVVKGAVDGEYPGEDVMWVGWAAEYEKAKREGRKPPGQEWPADGVRAVTDEDGVPPARNPFVNRELPKKRQAGVEGREGEREEGGSASFSTADFYRYDPHQPRDYHGRWTEGPEGGGRPPTLPETLSPPKPEKVDQARSAPRRTPVPLSERKDVTGPIGSGSRASTGYGAQLADPITDELPSQYERSKAYLESHGLDKEELVETLIEIAMRAGAENMAKWSRWYYDAHDLVVEWAKLYNTDAVRVAGILAALSPKTSWTTPLGKVGQNRVLAQVVLSEHFNHPDRELTIDDDFIAALSTIVEGKPATTPDLASTRKNPKNIALSVTRYNGRHPEFWGRDLRGVHKAKDLPDDVYVYLMRHNGIFRGLSASFLNAVAIARGLDIDSGLNTPKTRSFYNNLIDPYRSEDVTADTHHIRAITSRAPKLGINLTDDDYSAIVSQRGAYQYIHDVTVEAANRLNMLPHELQAVVWEQWRQENEPKEKAKITRERKARGEKK